MDTNAHALVLGAVVLPSAQSLGAPALNLQSGRYHGLNAVAARMLEAAAQANTVGDAVPSLAAHFEQPEDVIRRDLAQLCRDLEERGLVELQNVGAS